MAVSSRPILARAFCLVGGVFTIDRSVNESCESQVPQICNAHSGGYLTTSDTTNPRIFKSPTYHIEKDTAGYTRSCSPPIDVLRQCL